MPAQPWGLGGTDSPAAIILEIRHHQRAGTRKSELLLALRHATSKQLTIAQEEKAYKTKTPHVSRIV